MTAHDIGAVAGMDHDTSPAPWPEKVFDKELQLPLSQTLVALAGEQGEGRIEGFITFWVVADEVQLHKIAVRLEVRGKGIGAELLQAMLTQASDHGCTTAVLEVRRSNETAIRLYKKFGFCMTAVRPGYYDPGREDALLMSANIGQNRKS